MHDTRCIQCGLCVHACQQNAISITQGKRNIDRKKCNICQECAAVCPSGSIEIVGREVSVEEVLEEIEKDRLFYSNSGGGVTVSGGEPLMQWEFARDLLKACKKSGFHTVLDTAGYAQSVALEATLDFVDLVLYDVKHSDSERHKQRTGVGNEKILENAAIVASKTSTWFRIPLIPGFNDSVSCIREISRLASRLCVEKISLLPYHRWGVPKYLKLGQEYKFDCRSEIGDDQIRELSDVVRKEGLQVSIGS